MTTHNLSLYSNLSLSTGNLFSTLVVFLPRSHQLELAGHVFLMVASKIGPAGGEGQANGTEEGNQQQHWPQQVAETVLGVVFWQGPKGRGT